MMAPQSDCLTLPHSPFKLITAVVGVLLALFARLDDAAKGRVVK
jgi:hypothetical protein